jgi:hypothetical protein
VETLREAAPIVVDPQTTGPELPLA